MQFLARLLAGFMITGLVLGGCSSAPKSGNVSAAYVPRTIYASLTCDQLLQEVESIRRSVPAMAQAVDDRRTNQTGVVAAVRR